MKYRLDQLLVQRNFYSSREKAKGHILAGDVIVDNKTITKVGSLVHADVDIRIKSQERYVSRGGYKLEKALKSFSIDVTDLVVIDIGSSTGGFSDCLLQHGAKYIYSIDVGYNQLSFTLRNHPQIKVYEKLNAKDLSKNLFDKPIQLAVIDVSFISITKILIPVLNILTDKRIIALIKPQFEVGNSVSHFDGIVKNSSDHIKAINDLKDFVLTQNLYTADLTYSPIKGPKGNIEYLIYLIDQDNNKEINTQAIVEESHKELNIS